jgi:Uroporphyrinogen decarboxylase (URO-D)
MDPKHFPYDRYHQVKAEKDSALYRFVNSPTIEDIPIIVRPPCDIYGAVARDRVRSLELQLDALLLALDHKSDFMFSYLEPWHGVGIYASIFGCPVNWYDFDAPQTLPIIKSVDELKDLKRPKVLASDMVQMVLETIRYFRRATHDQIDIILTDTQSPNDNASLIMDTCEFFACSLSSPERLVPFMNLITDVMIEFSEMQFEALGPTASRPGHIMVSAPELQGISISDDNMAVISHTSYLNSALAYNSRLGEYFGGVSIHTCGNFVQNYATIKQVKNLVLIDCPVSGADPLPNDPRKLSQAFANTDTIIKARIGGEEHWGVLEDLIDPDLKLIIQIDSDGDTTKSNLNYERLKERCMKIMTAKRQVDHH